MLLGELDDEDAAAAEQGLTKVSADDILDLEHAEDAPAPTTKWNFDKVDG